MKKILLNTRFLAIVFLFVNLLFASVAFGQATVETDQYDYSPGSTAIITGFGFQPGEYVELHVHHADGDPFGTDAQYHQPWYVTADAQGKFTTSWYVPTETEGDALGATLSLEAHGNMDSVAEWIFTDGPGDPFYSASISPTVWTLVAPSTYSITISNLITNAGNPTHIGNIGSVEVVIPTGAGTLSSISIVANDPGSLSRTWTLFSQTSTLLKFKNGVSGGGAAASDIDPGGTIVITFTTTATTPGSKVWATTVYKGNNFNNPGLISGTQPTVAIDKATPVVTPIVGTYIFNGSPQGPNTATSTGTGTSYTFSYSGTSNASVAYGPSATAPTNAGSYTVTATVAASTDGNYNSASSNATAFTIARAPSVTTVTIAAGPHVYTGSAQTPASVTVIGANLSLTPAPVYADNVNAGTANASYTYAESANHFGSNDNKDFAITQKAASVVVDSQTKVYGSADPTLTGVLTGFMPADNVVATYSRAAGETVLGGPYAITAVLSPAGVLSNYNITNTASTLAITVKAASVVVDSQTKEYGSADPTLTGVLTGFMPADNVVATYSRAAGETVLGGPYAITAVLSPAGVLSNYNITNTASTLAITVKAASVSPIAKGKYCGQTDPEFTGTLSGFIAGDNVTVVYSRTTGEVAGGTYSISAVLSPVSKLSNYNITYNTATFTINGVSIDASVSSTPVPINTAINLRASVSPAVAGVSVTFYKDNAQIGTAVITDETGLAQLNIGILPTEVYQIKAVAGSGCAESIVYLPVYDPSGGFVTGGGWINSPSGAYAAGLGLSGKANFGFVAKYKKGSNAVDGNTEFQFHAGSFNFKSNIHDAGTLVIAGSKATYRGVGTVNGGGSFGFLVIAVDGVITGGGGTDKFRIKIWDKNNGNTVVYDNEKLFDENDVPTTLLGGGSIVIHQVKKGSAKIIEVKKVQIIEPVAVSLPVEPSPFSITAYPNPSNSYFTVELLGGSTEKISVVVYDMLGRTVKRIDNSNDQQIKFGEELPAGVYIATISQGTNQKTVRLIKE